MSNNITTIGTTVSLPQSIGAIHLAGLQLEIHEGTPLPTAEQRRNLEETFGIRIEVYDNEH